MKKTKLITSLSAAFLTATALASCSIVKVKSGVILIYDGKEYTAEDLYGDQKSAAAAEAKFNAVYKVAVRRYFEEGQEGHSYMEQITRDTKNKVSGQKATAKSNADANHTSYDTEWEKILDSNGVDDEDELYHKFEYELQKEKFEDKFYDSHYDVLRKGGAFDSGMSTKLEKGYLEAKQPYHMKHILIKLTAADGDCTTGEISKENAQKIHDVITHLAKGDMTFEEVSDIYNDDDSAKSAKSSLGIMSRDTSFVNDFKLGVYFYEAFKSKSTDGTTEESKAYEPKNAKKELGLIKEEDATEGAAYYADLINKLEDPTTNDPTKTGEGAIKGVGIGQIPYEAVLALGSEQYEIKNSDTETDLRQGVANVDLTNSDYSKVFKDAGLDSSKIENKFLPRNVIFNKYFNKHNIMVITPNIMSTAIRADKASNFIQDYKARTSTVDKYHGTYYADYAKLPGFSRDPKNNDILDKIFYNEGAIKNPQNTVLRDNNGRTILVFRSGTSGDTGYQGIHIAVIERSPFIGKEFDDKDSEKKEIKPTTLDEYYTHYYPGQTDGNHPKYDDGEYKHTFVNYNKYETEEKKIKSRADTVKSELKKANSHLNMYVYDYLVEKGSIKFADTTQAKAVESDINNWKDITKKATEIDDKKSWDDTWQNYYFSLAAQNEQRKEIVVDEEVKSNLVPQICAEIFTTYGKDSTKVNDIKGYFGDGGVFSE